MARNQSPPTSQKADKRPISFNLTDLRQGQQLCPTDRTVTLYIRPEDMSRTDPLRATVQQTLASSDDGVAAAWVDSFGPGLGQITISGHTGWHRDDKEAEDGEARFKRLKQSVFTQWNSLRKEAIKSGQSPDLIQLQFVDTLHDTTSVVVPMSFTLRRNKQRPLLLQYQIVLIVISDEAEIRVNTSQDDDSPDADTKRTTGIESLAASIVKLQQYAEIANEFIDRTMAEPVQKFMEQTALLYNSVHDTIAAYDTVAESVISVAKTSAQAGYNLARTLAAVAGIPELTKLRLGQVAGAYTNVFCVISNALQQQRFYPDYSPLYGASNCSSTNGGRSLSSYADSNPFYDVVPSSSNTGISITTESRSAMQSLANNDVVLTPLSDTELASLVSTMSSGLEVTA